MAGIFREQVTKRLTRSSKWPKVRKAHLKENPTCANCGKKKRIGMQVHHIFPFHLYPDLELEPGNLLTLCNHPCCHFAQGHLSYWKSFNESVVNDCKERLGKLMERP